MGVETRRWDEQTDEEHAKVGNTPHRIRLQRSDEPIEVMASSWNVEPTSKALMVNRRILLDDDDEVHGELIINLCYRSFAEGEWIDCEQLACTFDPDAVRVQFDNQKNQEAQQAAIAEWQAESQRAQMFGVKPPSPPAMPAPINRQQRRQAEREAAKGDKRLVSVPPGDG